MLCVQIVFAAKSSVSLIIVLVCIRYVLVIVFRVSSEAEIHSVHK